MKTENNMNDFELECQILEQHLDRFNANDIEPGQSLLYIAHLSDGVHVITIGNTGLISATLLTALAVPEGKQLRDAIIQAINDTKPNIHEKH